jgi:hemoglobin
MKLSCLSMIFAAGLAACGGKTRGPDTGGAGGGAGGGDGSASSLYDRLGRRDAIALVVKDFVEQRVAKDNRINAFFAHAELPGLEAKLIDQDMKTAHAGMGVKDSDFTALVEDLRVSLDHFQVPAPEQQELIGKLATMHDVIVTAK